MGIGKFLKKAATKAVKFVKANPEIALAIAGAAAPVIAKKAPGLVKVVKKVAPIVKAVR